MSTGIIIRTFPLEEYPSESQKLMLRIVKDFESNRINVINYKGSYSITGIYNGGTAIKVLCTIGSSFEISGSGILVLFRKELVKKIGMNKIKKEYLNLDIKETPVSAGGGEYGDFYFTVIDSLENYLTKKDDILNLTTKIISE